MNKVMYDFLDSLYPTFFVHETKFGNALKYDGGLIFSAINKWDAMDSLCQFFSLTLPESDEVFESWVKTKPVYVRLGNSTTDVYVLKIPETYSSNTVV